MLFSWSVRRTLERRSERIRAVEFICGCELPGLWEHHSKSPPRLNLDGSLVLLGSTATHDSTPVKSPVDAAGDSLDETRGSPKTKGVII